VDLHEAPTFLRILSLVCTAQKVKYIDVSKISLGSVLVTRDERELKPAADLRAQLHPCNIRRILLLNNLNLKCAVRKYLLWVTLNE